MRELVDIGGALGDFLLPIVALDLCYVATLMVAAYELLMAIA